MGASGLPLIAVTSVLFLGLIGVVGYLAWKNRGEK